MPFGRRRKQGTKDKVRGDELAQSHEARNRELELQLDELEERIEELERRLAGAAELQARSLTLRDERGDVRARLTAGDQEGPELGLFDGEGRVRLRLRVVGDMPVFELRDAREHSKTWFGVGADGNPTIQLRDGTGRDRLAIGVSRRKGAKISVVDSEGTATAVMAEGVLMAEEGIVRKLYLKAEAEQQRAARPHLTVLQGGLSELEDEQREREE
jgi:hypothetical protein